MTSKREWTLELNTLSAFLDGELKKSERQHLQTRLAQEPELRERLENLRKTKVLLGSLPHLDAPRNFTLTPEMVKVREKKQPWSSVLQLASAMAAVFLVALVGLELVLNTPHAYRANDAMPLMESASDVEEPAAEPLIIWGFPDSGGLGGAGGTDMKSGVVSESFSAEEPLVGMDDLSSDEAEETMVEMEAPAEGEPDDAVAEMETFAQEEDMEAEQDSPPLEADSDEEYSQPEAEDPEPGMRAAPATDEDSLILGLNLEESGETIARSEPGTGAAEPVTTARDPNPFRLAQIILAVIAVGGGVALWILRKK